MKDFRLVFGVLTPCLICCSDAPYGDEGVMGRWPVGEVVIRVYRDDLLRPAVQAVRSWNIGALVTTGDVNPDIGIRWSDGGPVGEARVNVADGERITHAEITIDASLPWTTQGYDLDEVMLHEIGHALGLNHSFVPDDVMYPSIHSDDLTDNDKRRIQELYK